MNKLRLNGLGILVLLSLLASIIIPPLSQAMAKVNAEKGSSTTSEVAEKTSPEVAGSSSEVEKAEGSQESEKSGLDNSPEANDARVSAETYMAYAKAKKDLETDPTNEELKASFAKAEEAFKAIEAKEEAYDKANPCPDDDTSGKTENGQPTEGKVKTPEGGGDVG